MLCNPGVSITPRPGEYPRPGLGTHGEQALALSLRSEIQGAGDFAPRVRSRWEGRGPRWWGGWDRPGKGALLSWGLERREERLSHKGGRVRGRIREASGADPAVFQQTGVTMGVSHYWAEPYEIGILVGQEQWHICHFMWFSLTERRRNDEKGSEGGII